MTGTLGGSVVAGKICSMIYIGRMRNKEKLDVNWITVTDVEIVDMTLLCWDN